MRCLRVKVVAWQSSAAAGRKNSEFCCLDVFVWLFHAGCWWQDVLPPRFRDVLCLGIAGCPWFLSDSLCFHCCDFYSLLPTAPHLAAPKLSIVSPRTETRKGHGFPCTFQPVPKCRCLEMVRTEAKVCNLGKIWIFGWRHWMRNLLNKNRSFVNSSAPWGKLQQKLLDFCHHDCWKLNLPYQNRRWQCFTRVLSLRIRILKRSQRGR